MNPQFMMIFQQYGRVFWSELHSYVPVSISIMNAMLLLAMEMTDETVTRVI